MSSLIQLVTASPEWLGPAVAIAAAIVAFIMILGGLMEELATHSMRRSSWESTYRRRGSSIQWQQP